jgi:hypothetical protein
MPSESFLEWFTAICLTITVLGQVVIFILNRMRRDDA